MPQYRILCDDREAGPYRYVIELEDDAAAEAYCDAIWAAWVRVGSPDDQWQFDDRVEQ